MVILRASPRSLSLSFLTLTLQQTLLKILQGHHLLSDCRIGKWLCHTAIKIFNPLGDLPRLLLLSPYRYFTFQFDYATADALYACCITLMILFMLGMLFISYSMKIWSYIAMW